MSDGLRAVIERLESGRIEISARYEERLRRRVRAYAGISSTELVGTASLLLHMFARLLATSAEGQALDLGLIAELEEVSRARARQGVAVGDLFAAIVTLVSAAREVVFERAAESDLRVMSAAWSEVESLTAVVLAWMIDQHAATGQ